MTTRKIVWTIVAILVLVGLFIIYNVSNEREPVEVIDQENKIVIKPSPTPENRPLVTKPTQVTQTNPTADWKSHTDTRFKASIKYPSSWNQLTGESYPYSFSVVSQRSPNEINAVTISQTDGCVPNVQITFAGQKAYDSGWTGAAQPTRKVCFPDKKYLINMSAVDTASKLIEESILASLMFN